MDHNNPEGPRDPGGESGLTAGCQVSDPFCPEKEQKRCMVTDDVTTHGSWSQSSISRSLQRAEVLLRSTFNPSLKWLFHGPGPDEDSDEGNFVAAHNLVSRSSARLLRLQQALFTVAPQWQLVGGAQAGAAQVCVKGLSAEGAVLLPPCSSFLQEHYRSLKRLLEQRSLLLFSHEYIRRTRLTAAYISRLSHLLETSHITLNQTPSNWVSYSVGLSSLSHELRVHLNHWSCLFSKVQSDQYLRPAMAQQTRLLAEMKQTLSSLGLQAMVLMEKYVYVILSAVAQTPLDHVPTDVLEDILAGTDLYNQVMEEQKHRATQLRTAVLHQANHSTLGCGLPVRKEHHPAAFSVKELTMILSVHHARLAANELQCWASIHSHHICPIHSNHEVHASSVNSRISCTQRPEWTWEQLQQTYLTTPPLLTDNHHHKLHSPSHHSSGCIPHHHPVSVRPPSVQHRTHTSNKDQTNRCQRNTSQTGGAETSVEALDSDIGGYSRTTPPTGSFHHLLTQQDRPSVELLYQLLVSSRDLMAPLVSHLSTPETEQLLPNTATDVISPRRRMNAQCSPALVINAVDSAQERLCSETKKEQNKGNQPVWAELQITTRPEATSSSGFQRTVDPEKEKTTGEPDYGCWPHSVQWLDLGQSLVFADLLRQYRTRLWTLCCRTLWLQMCVPHTGNTVVCINLQDNYWAFQLLHWARQVSNTDHVPTECRAMLEDFSLTLLDMTAHAQWDNVLCIGLGSALKDKCLADVSPGGSVMSATMKHFLLLTPPLLSSLNHHQSNSSTVGSLQRHIVSLVLATVQLCTVWIMSKSYQFLSSWSLNKFLLITHGDLRVFRNSLGTMMHLTKSLVMNSDSDNCSALYSHCQSLMRQQLGRLDRAVSELQTFSSLVLKTFSTDCKRMSGQIFEQAMPPSVHWRPSHRTGFPNSPNEYASVAAQTVIGQVLEGVAPLSDDARIQALSITMTAFLEAWMEHILRQKIKFSLQGALQLKQDFDSIKDLIQSDRYGLSADLLQQLLGLRVFQQVDSAVMCLLQQPQAKPYLQSRSWVPFTRCCPTNNRSSTDAPSRSSITNLRCVEGEDPADPSVVMSDLPPVDSSAPGEPYLAPSVALGAAQQDWLDLRIHSSARRWKLPGLQCLSKSEP